MYHLSLTKANGCLALNPSGRLKGRDVSHLICDSDWHPCWSLSVLVSDPQAIWRDLPETGTSVLLVNSRDAPHANDVLVSRLSPNTPQIVAWTRGWTHHHTFPSYMFMAE